MDLSVEWNVYFTLTPSSGDSPYTSKRPLISGTQYDFKYYTTRT